MAMLNISIAGIESYQPALDYRKSERHAVLGGKNFAWDAAGAHSAYSSRLVSGSDSIGLSPAIAQTLDLEDMTHVAVENKIWHLLTLSEGSLIGEWEEIDELVPIVTPTLDLIPYNFRKWTTAYLGGKRYACAYNYGVFRVEPGNPPTYTRLVSGAPVGFPDDSDPVIAIAETNGRMLYLTRTTLYWSGAATPEDLTPALGGAGFQVVGERIAGTPFALTSTSVGAIVWTSVGALVAEFVGGTGVFRFWQLSTEALPTSSFSITQLPDDTYVILTRLGLYQVQQLSQPQSLTPVFNEYLREYLRTRISERGHIWYSINENRLYVAFRGGRSTFNETYALDMALDKWGIFSEQHLGMFNYGPDRGQIAYIDSRGIASYLLSSLDPRKGKENPINPGELLGLGSEITIGWIRATEFLMHADVTQETQEILVSRSIPSITVTIERFDEEFLISASPDEYDEGLIGDLVDVFIDEGGVSEQATVVNYRLQILTDIFKPELGDAVDDMNIFATLVRQDQYSDLWVGMVPAVYHRLRFFATEADEFFRVNTMDLTVTYTGNLS